jgi:thiol-disulfide isomerase/thioredoxin
MRFSLPIALLVLALTACSFYRSFDPNEYPRGEGIEYLRPPLLLDSGALDFGIGEGMTWEEANASMTSDLVLFVRFSPECPVSREVLPHLAALVPFHEHQGFRVVAVSTADTPPEEAVRHMGFHEIRIPLFHERERSRDLFPTDVTPSAALVDDRGRIFARYRWARPQRPTAEDIEVSIDRLLRGNPWRP